MARQRIATLGEDDVDPYELFRATISSVGSGPGTGPDPFVSFRWSACASLALALAHRGELTAAAREAELILAEWSRIGEPPVRDFNEALQARAVVALDTGRPAEAEELVERGLRLLAPSDNVVYHLGMAIGLRAEIARARGRPGEALAMLEEPPWARSGVVAGPELLARLAEVEVAAALDLGDIDRARAALGAVVTEPAGSFARARVLLAAGEVAEAERIVAAATPNSRRRRVERELLLARAALDRDPEAARSHVVDALRSSGGERLGWTFVRERELAAVYHLPAIARRLPWFASRDAVPVELEAGLSRRELEVLRALTTPHTNQELANALFVSVNTLRVHLRSVYRKLGAGSRGEALAQAARLGLLDDVPPPPVGPDRGDPPAGP
jgi:LuxR family transcriptional regulator, maltose regulon positive regulatory protein